MSPTERSFCVVNTNDVVALHDDASAVLGPTPAPRVWQRVCRIVEDSPPHRIVAIGALRFRVLASETTRIHNARFDIGDAVAYKDRTGTIREIIWHYGREEPMYFLTVVGKRVSKRYFNGDLSPAAG